MIKFNYVSIKNFMSFGNVPQQINLNSQQLSVVLGKNLDDMNSSGISRNGAGKSSVLSAILFALYGSGIGNIKKDNLVNHINNKNMVVILEFEKNMTKYRIERGRKPSFLKFYVNDKSVLNESEEKNEAQGENKETQDEIEKILNISPELFKQIIGLNTYSEPFLSTSIKNQREIIEELLGITVLSDKAENLKELIRETKDLIKQEEVKIKTINESNERISKTIKDLVIKSESWESQKENKIKNLSEKIQLLMDLDIDEEINKHKLTKEYKDKNLQLKTKKKQRDHLLELLESYCLKIEKYENEIEKTKNNSCPTCGHDLNEKIEKIMKEIEDKKENLETKIKKHANEISVLDNEISLLESEISPIKNISKTFYSDIDEAYNHKTILEKLASTIEGEMDSINPFLDQIESLKKTSILEIDCENLIQYKRLLEHQEFLLKLLVNKDSFIRKKIIEQNIGYLNFRLSHYLEKLGMTHKVKFMPDLSVEIKNIGNDMDFDNLSRGEKTRVTLSLNWAFLDVFESINSKVNLIYLDEIIDNGLDAPGREGALEILKFMNRNNHKSIFIVSHHEDLQNRVNNTIMVTKENGFSTILNAD